MRITVTGASGRIGSKLVESLLSRGDEVAVLSRAPQRTRESLGVEAFAWDPQAGPAPAEALRGRDAVVHLAGEDVGQRWTGEVRKQILVSRDLGTRNLVDGLRGCDSPPGVLVSASAVGYYGPRGDELITEESSPGSDFLARVCIAWERQAAAAEEIGLRVARIRTGIVLDPAGGALARLLPIFRLGLGGHVASGRQYMPWITVDDLRDLYLAALDGAGWNGPINASAPNPVTNAEFARTLGSVLSRPAVLPAPGLALRAALGEMSTLVIDGQRAIPQRALSLDHRFKHRELEGALRAVLVD